MTFMYDIIYICQHGGIGRRTGLKIQRWQHRAGSTPAAGIMIKTRFLGLVFFIIYTFCRSYWSKKKQLFLKLNWVQVIQRLQI